MFKLNSLVNVQGLASLLEKVIKVVNRNKKCQTYYIQYGNGKEL